jgi:N-methylhydantoinase A
MPHRVVGEDVRIVHGSTVATNALPTARRAVAFITTEGFRDMLLIGRQNRPALRSTSTSPPITPQENWFTVRERISRGRVVAALPADITRVLTRSNRGLSTSPSACSSALSTLRTRAGSASDSLATG